MNKLPKWTRTPKVCFYPQNICRQYDRKFLHIFFKTWPHKFQGHCSSQWYVLFFMKKSVVWHNHNRFSPQENLGKTSVNNMTENFYTYFSRCDHINFKDIVVVNGTYCCLWRKVLFDIIITGFHPKRTCLEHINRTNWYFVEKKNYSSLTASRVIGINICFS